MPEEVPSLSEMVAILVRGLVERPDAVEVFEKHRSDSSAIELRVAPEDLGKVIGRQGRTARALRTLLNLAGEKLRRRCQLQILE
jgi:uncharacterized protein